ncbi:MAG: hypothetical protein QM638_21075 [Nocardioides sp.]|uniref:hypothetical protein n=1 Tax=Nocardioides sp. TaxID=35761 RepID=UPI0039E563C1
MTRDEVSLTHSYARRTEQGVWVELLLPGSAVAEGETVLRFRASDGRRRRMSASAVATGEGAVRVTVTEPRRLGAGTWWLSVRDDQSWRPLGARVVTGPRPTLTSLVVGPAPLTRMAPPVLTPPAPPVQIVAPSSAQAEPVAPRALRDRTVTELAQGVGRRGRRLGGRAVRALRRGAP